MSFQQRMRKRFGRVCSMALLGLLALPPLAAATPIQRTIVVDGDTSDWKTAPDITNNPGQYSTDPTTYPPDLDIPQATGRDLARFAYTYDSTDLFLWVRRAGSANNQTYWWFYIDTNNDGLMQSSDVLLLVTWQGSNGNLTRAIFSYNPARSGGDPLTCPATGINSVADAWCPVAGVADGYDMPGGKTTVKTLSSQSGGLPNGLEMETSIPWSELGASGPVSLQFHISSSNGQNIPSQLDDNMDGPAGGSLSFIDLDVDKVSSNTTAAGNTTFAFTIDITNNDTTNAANNVAVTDAIPANLTFQSYTATQGTYDSGTGIWTLGTLAANGGTARLVLTVRVDDISSSGTITNTAATSAHDEPDSDTTNNSASVDVDLIPGPNLIVSKTVSIIDDGVTTTGNDKAIPGARMRYTVVIENSSATAAAENVLVTDPIPTNATYYPASITLNGTAQGDGTGDGDDSDFNQTTPGAVSSDLGDLGASSTLTVTFEVIVD
jgi:uncharacterized repeat protein (TIGR01451 family)